MNSKLWLGAALVGVALTACNNLDEAEVTSERATITGQIAGATTRASGTAWAAGDAIGVTAMSVEDATSTVHETERLNVRYVTAQGDGNFEVATGVTDITYGGTRRVNFAAYYPYAEAGGTLDVQTDAEHQTAALQPTIDYLYATGTGRITRPEVSLQFAHRMSQVVLNFTAGTGVTDLTQISDLKLGQLVLTGTFDTQMGVAAASTDATASTLDVATESGTFTEDNTTSSYRLILLPQEVSELSLSLALGGKTYATTLTVPNLVAGSSVSFDITVNEASLSIRDGSIIAWAETTGGYNTVTYGDITDLDQVQVLDLAMSDGSFARVWDDDETKMLSTLINFKHLDEVRGIVFWKGDPTDGDAIFRDKYPNCTHGLVLALQQTQTAWISSYDFVYASFQSQANSGVNPAETSYLSIATVLASSNEIYENGSSISVRFSDYDRVNAARGFNNTQVLEQYATSKNATVNILTALHTYEEEHPAPTNSSGWYIPTFMDFLRWMDNDIAGFTAKYITTSSSQLANIKTLLGKLSTAGRSDVSTSFSQSYWASSEVYCPSEFNTNAYYLNIKAWYSYFYSSNNTWTCGISADEKSVNNYLLPICAF